MKYGIHSFDKLYTAFMFNAIPERINKTAIKMHALKKGFLLHNYIADERFSRKAQMTNNNNSN